MTDIAALLIENQRLQRENEDLRYQLSVANRELERLAPYANIPAPPLTKTQLEIMMSPIELSYRDNDGECKPLPPLRLR